MPPHSDDPKDNDQGIKITSGIPLYPSNRDHAMKTPEIWLRGKKKDDAVDPYWRLHDKLYDFSDFINSHPGGKFWLEETRGMDITESFESSHITSLPEKMLKKYYIKDITTPRNTPFTFHENGFYQTLKRKAVPIFKKHGGSGPTREMTTIIDSLLIGVLLSMYFSAALNSYAIAVIGGICLLGTGVAAHNFFHQKDNWRMFYFDMTVLSSRDWRISHAISHHNYPNTIYDFEISSLEPNIKFFPSDTKSFWYQITLIPKLFIFMPINFHLEYIKNIINGFTGLQKPRFTDLLPVMQYIAMVFINGSAWKAFWLFFTLHTTCNFIFHFFGLQAAHHHYEIFHEGDVYPGDNDWGKHQVITTRERGQPFFYGPLILIATTFGNHTLHHLFPTVCHSKLVYIQDIFLETCKEFGINFDPQEMNPIKHFQGYWHCLTSTEGIKKIPNIMKKTK